MHTWTDNALSFQLCTTRQPKFYASKEVDAKFFHFNSNFRLAFSLLPLVFDSHSQNVHRFFASNEIEIANWNRESVDFAPSWTWRPGDRWGSTVYCRCLLSCLSFIYYSLDGSSSLTRHMTCANVISRDPGPSSLVDRWTFYRAAATTSEYPSKYCALVCAQSWNGMMRGTLFSSALGIVNLTR